MITKFRSINGMAVFHNFEWDRSARDSGGPIQLKQVNVMYGRNYSGKTTLSRIVRAFETGTVSDKYGTPSFSVVMDDGRVLTEKSIHDSGLLVRVFNEDFVRDNLRFVIDPNADVVPFAVLGEDNTRIEAEINEIKAKLGLSDPGAETGLYAEKKEMQTASKQANDVLSSANDTLAKQKRRKATDTKTGIKYQVGRFNVQNYDIRNLNDDINIVLSDKYKVLSEEEIHTYETALVEQRKSTVPAISAPTLSLSKLIAVCREICERKIGTSEKIQELLRNAALEQWVKSGLILNKGRATCAFCGQPINQSRWDELYRHFDEETEKLSRDIDQLLHGLNDEQKKIESGFNPDKTCFYAIFLPELENLILEYEGFKQSYICKLDALRVLAEKRKNSIHQEVVFEFQEQTFQCAEIFEKYKEIQERSNNYGREIENAKRKAQEALRYAEVERFLHEIDYKSQMSTIATLEKDAKEKKIAHERVTQEIASLERDIEAKRRLLNDEEKGALHVNDFLSKYFKHKYLSLQAVEAEEFGEKKIHFEVVRNGKKAYHLSEGECSLIAFCYFVAKLNDVNTSGKKPIIWIDDPISSLDSNHIYFVYSLITQEILAKDAYEQLFITTHNLQFLKYLRVLSINKHNKSEKDNARINLLVERRGDVSCILPMPKYLKDHGTEFNHWFECIFKCAEINAVNDENVYLFESFGNNARKFLETYLYYRYPDKDTFDEHLLKFFGTERIPPIIVGKLSDEMSHGNGDLENHDIPFDEPEVIEAARLIIKRLKEFDTTQYESLVSSIQ